MNDQHPNRVSVDDAAVPSDALRTEARARLELARAAAAEVGKLSRRWYQSADLAVERKPDGSVVTPVDRDGETLIRERIASAFSGDSILGEEHGASGGDGAGGWRWVIDPIDGTRSFTCGTPSYCTLIGIEFDGQPIAGLANFPALGERLDAVRGEGAVWLTASGSERSAVAARVDDVSSASIQLGAPTSIRRGGSETAHPRVAAAVRRIRGWDDGFAFALAATGRVDGAVQGGLSRWDLSAFMPILAEAGAVVDGWIAGDDPLEAPGNVIVGTGPLVAGLQRVIAG